MTIASITRRKFAALAGAAALARPAAAQTGTPLSRAIPSSGELLPAVGLGTAYVFNNNDETTRQKAAAVVKALIAGGGKLIDTASTYGDAESASQSAASGQATSAMAPSFKPSACRLSKTQP